MPVDYSKWDALELSDDSDIEVHPNVDKRSFIRAKQNQIHQERSHRKNQIETLKYERIINEGLLKRIGALLKSLQAHASEVTSKNPGDIAFRAVMESAVNPSEDTPPPRPAGVHFEEHEVPMYSKMLATLLDQVNQELDKQNIDKDKPKERFQAMVKEIQTHEDKVTGLQKDLIKKLAELQQEDGKKITSDGLREGFNSSHVNKSGQGSKGASTSTIELLNPEHTADASSKPGGSKTADPGEDEGGEEEIEATPLAKAFADIKMSDYSGSLQFLTKNRELLNESNMDGILAMAFDAGLEGNYDKIRQYVHQALLIQYCRNLGRDGVPLFFKRIMSKEHHQAQDVFNKDVQDTYQRIRNRTREMVSEQAANADAGEEQIQLHSVDPGTVIHIQVPPAESNDEAEQAARKIFDGFKPDMQQALQTGKLDEVNKVLGKMTVEEAEEVVGLFGEANIVSLEDEILDTTTEEGQKHLKELEDAAVENRRNEVDDE